MWAQVCCGLNSGGGRRTWGRGERVFAWLPQFRDRREAFYRGDEELVEGEVEHLQVLESQALSELHGVNLVRHHLEVREVLKVDEVLEQHLVLTNIEIDQIDEVFRVLRVGLNDIEF